MSTRILPRVTLHTDPPRDFSSMPICGVCRMQIERGETYAGVLYAKDDPLTGRKQREVRHNTDFCLRYECGPALVLVPGALVYSHRYQLTDRGGTIPGVVVERTEEFGEFGRRGYVVRPETPELSAQVIEPEGRKVFISDEEWVHYVLPS